MKRKSYPKVNDNEGAKQLACAVILEVAKTILSRGNKSTDERCNSEGFAEKLSA